MNKIKKILFLVNDLGFFYSHRLSIAEAAMRKGFDVFIGYGDLGNVNLDLFTKRGLKVYLIPMQRSSMNPFKELKTLFSILKLLKLSHQILFI